MKKRTFARVALSLLLPLLLSDGAAAQRAAWASGFEPSGADAAVRAWAVFDDGSGPALYVGGEFVTIGGAVANGLARFDGDAWEAVGLGVVGFGDGVEEMLVHDDGSGSALYVAGSFFSVDGVAAAGIARLTATGWESVGGSLLNGGSGRALAVHDDGSGAALYFGGSYARIGGVNASAVARWDGAVWSPVGLGLSARVDDFEVYDDGSGPQLYACGELRNSGATQLSKLARWDGASWGDVGGGTNFDANALAVYAGELVVAGRFTQAGGVPMAGVTRWDGSSFAPLGTGLSQFGDAYALAVHGSSLYVGGSFFSAGGVAVNNVARWDGASWSALRDAASGTDGTNAVVYSLWVDPSVAPGDGPDLYAGGKFTAAGGETALHAARWTQGAWSALASGEGVEDPVQCFALFDDGATEDGTPSLFAGGAFERAGSAASYALARWRDGKWEPFGDLVDRDVVSAMAVFDDGAGPALYVGGSFRTIGGVFVNNIARWDGASWSALGFGVDSSVLAMTVHDDGSGPALFVGGLFPRASGAFVNSIAKWDGASWSALGGGVRGRAFALESFDDGTGPALFVGGNFLSVEGTSIRVDHVARWSGGAWSAMAGGVVSDFGSSSIVTTLRAVDLPAVGGKRLIVGGGFDTAGGTGGIRVNNIAAWDGTTWSALGAGFEQIHDTVYALTVVEGNDGGVLFAGGRLRTSNGVATPLVARWNGSTWNALDQGLSGSKTPSTTEFVDAFAQLPASGGRGPRLVAGGDFLAAGDRASNHVAAWVMRPATSATRAQVPAQRARASKRAQPGASALRHR